MEILNSLDTNIINYVIQTTVINGIGGGCILGATLSLFGLGGYKAFCLIDIKH